MLSPTSKVLIAAMLCGATLTACSSGGSDGPSFDGYVNEGEALFSEMQDLEYTDPATLPVTGSATYNGVMAIAVDAGIDDIEDIDPASVLVGDLAMNVGFADESISGRVSNIVDGNSDRYQGSLSIDDNYFSRDFVDYTYAASLTGSVTDPDGNEWDVDAEMAGDFFGSDWSHTYGDAYGEACSTALETCSSLEGEYIAKR